MSNTVQWTKLRAIFFLGVLLLKNAASAQTKEEFCCSFETNKKPVWGTILQTPAPAIGQDRYCKWIPHLPGEIAYATQDRVIVAIHFDCYTAGVDRGHSEDRLLQIDSRTGAILKQASWEDLSLDNTVLQLLAAGHGRVLLRAGTTLKLLSADLEEIRTRTVPAEDADLPLVDVHLSPSGRIGLLKYAKGKVDRSLEQWFSLETLGEITTETAPHYSGFVAIGDDFQEYYSPYSPWRPVTTREQMLAQVRNEPVVHVRTKSEAVGHALCDSCAGSPLMATRNGWVILEKNEPGASFLLVNPSGNIVYEGAYGVRIDRIGEIVAASERDRFAFSCGHLRIGLFRDVGPFEAVVFDMVTIKEVLRLKVKAYPQIDLGEFWPQPRIALSPDGERLAVLYGSALRLFAIR
jgi:hypothetical protein